MVRLAGKTGPCLILLAFLSVIDITSSFAAPVEQSDAFSESSTPTVGTSPLADFCSPADFFLTSSNDANGKFDDADMVKRSQGNSMTHFTVHGSMPTIDVANVPFVDQSSHQFWPEKYSELPPYNENKAFQKHPAEPYSFQKEILQEYESKQKKKSKGSKKDKLKSRRMMQAFPSDADSGHENIPEFFKWTYADDPNNKPDTSTMWNMGPSNSIDFDDSHPTNELTPTFGGNPAPIFLPDDEVHESIEDEVADLAFTPVSAKAKYTLGAAGATLGSGLAAYGGYQVYKNRRMQKEMNKLKMTPECELTDLLSSDDDLKDSSRLVKRSGMQPGHGGVPAYYDEVVSHGSTFDPATISNGGNRYGPLEYQSRPWSAQAIPAKVFETPYEEPEYHGYHYGDDIKEFEDEDDGQSNDQQDDFIPGTSRLDGIARGNSRKMLYQLTPSAFYDTPLPYPAVPAAPQVMMSATPTGFTVTDPSLANDQGGLDMRSATGSSKNEKIHVGRDLAYAAAASGAVIAGGYGLYRGYQHVKKGKKKLESKTSNVGATYENENLRKRSLSTNYGQQPDVSYDGVLPYLDSNGMSAATQEEDYVHPYYQGVSRNFNEEDILAKYPATPFNAPEYDEDIPSKKSKESRRLKRESRRLLQEGGVVIPGMPSAFGPPSFTPSSITPDIPQGLAPPATVVDISGKQPKLAPDQGKKDLNLGLIALGGGAGALLLAGAACWYCAVCGREHKKDTPPCEPAQASRPTMDPRMVEMQDQRSMGFRGQGGRGSGGRVIYGGRSIGHGQIPPGEHSMPSMPPRPMHQHPMNLGPMPYQGAPMRPQGMGYYPRPDYYKRDLESLKDEDNSIVTASSRKCLFSGDDSTRKREFTA